MALQVEILLVLSGHPNGRATVAAMNADLKFFAGAGPEWSQRVRRLASNAPGLDVFTEGYVVRDAAGWSITDAGRKALQRMERPIQQPPASPATEPTPRPVPAPMRPAVSIVARGTPVAPPSSSKVKRIAMSERRRLPRFDRS